MLPGTGEWFIASPLIALLLFAVALAVASLLMHVLPSLRDSMATAGPNRQPAVDGLRGVLGVSVFVHHTVITWFYLQGHGWTLPPSRFISHLGQTSVVLFFMITAFLFWSRVLAKGDSIDWLEFLVSRLYRLYPVYLLMVALLAAAVLITTAARVPPTFASFGRPLLDWLLFTMFGNPDLNAVQRTWIMVAGVTWSLRYEWLFYLALPLLALAARRNRPALAALLSTLAIAVFVLRPHNKFAIGMMQAFAGGIIAAYWVRNPALVRFSQRTVSGLAAIAALAAVIMLSPTGYSVAVLPALILFFVTVASGNDFWGLLRLPALRWLGDITYSLYLLHGLTLWAVFQCWFPRELAGNGWAFLGMAILLDVILVLVCSAVFVMIERPAIMVGRRHYLSIRRFRAKVPINRYAKLSPVVSRSSTAL